MTTQADVRKASQEFYAALNRMANGDAAAMADVWSQGAAATAMHPIGGRDVGREAVLASFQGVAGIASDARIGLEDQILHIVGDLAYELGSERGQVKLAGQQVSIDHRVTNIYQREADGWKIVHHHTDVSPAMVAIVERLKAGK